MYISRNSESTQRRTVSNVPIRINDIAPGEHLSSSQDPTPRTKDDLMIPSTTASPTNCTIKKIIGTIVRVQVHPTAVTGQNPISNIATTAMRDQIRTAHNIPIKIFWVTFGTSFC